MTSCAKCRAGPAGIEGHVELFAFRLNGSSVQFKCMGCDGLWIRAYSGDGQFTWTQLLEVRSGLPVPGSRAR